MQWATRVSTAQATRDEALAELERARLKYKSEIDGVNTSVANMEAQLRQAQYYLDNTTLMAPEDGRIINLQVRPGMVSGIYRIGGIAALIAEADRYVLATFYQENLKYVRPGQPVEVVARSLSRPDLRRQGRQHLARQRGGPVSAERRNSKIPAAASQRPPRPIRGEDHPGRSRTSRNFPSARKAPRPSTPAVNMAPGLRCARFRSAPTRG